MCSCWRGVGWVLLTLCLSGAVELCVPDLVFHPRLFSCVLRAFPEGDLNYATPKVDVVWVLNMDTATLPCQAALSRLAGGTGQGSFSQTSWPSEAFACLPGGVWETLPLSLHGICFNRAIRAHGAVGQSFGPLASMRRSAGGATTRGRAEARGRLPSRQAASAPSMTVATPSTL